MNPYIKTDETEIDLLDLGRYLLHRMVWILIAGVIVAAGAGIYARYISRVESAPATATESGSETETETETETDKNGNPVSGGHSSFGGQGGQGGQSSGGSQGGSSGGGLGPRETEEEHFIKFW